jgi:cobalt-zinc-cadmium efflux system protein
VVASPVFVCTCAMGAGHRHGGRGRFDANADVRRRLTITFILVTAYMIAEAIGGVLSNSLALLADAGHMFADAAALALALFAIWFARRPATTRHTYGYYRAEILAALLNAGSLIAIAVFIFIEAYGRFRNPPVVDAQTMIWIAVGGLVVNVISLWTLQARRDESLNIRGAWLHVLSDALGSLQAIAAGVLLLVYDWRWADPVASVLIGLLVLYSSWDLMKESVTVLMESAPAGIDVDQVRQRLLGIDGVEDVRDLHVWTITSGLVALSAHVVAQRPDVQVLHDLQHELEERFGIHHTTIQFDPPDEAAPHGPRI